MNLLHQAEFSLPSLLQATIINMVVGERPRSYAHDLSVN